MTRDEFFTFKNVTSWWRDLIGMGSWEDHKGFGALHPRFLGEGARTATKYCQSEFLDCYSNHGKAVECSGRWSSDRRPHSFVRLKCRTLRGGLVGLNLFIVRLIVHADAGRRLGYYSICMTCTSHLDPMFWSDAPVCHSVRLFVFKALWYSCHSIGGATSELSWGWDKRLKRGLKLSTFIYRHLP